MNDFIALNIVIITAIHNFIYINNKKDLIILKLTKLCIEI